MLEGGFVEGMLSDSGALGVLHPVRVSVRADASMNEVRFFDFIMCYVSEGFDILLGWLYFRPNGFSFTTLVALVE